MEKKDLQSIVDEFLKYDVSSESEVRSKLIDHLIVFLGYTPELRAEEFPVYGYKDDKQLRAKPADYITFKSNDYVQHKGNKSQASLEWVRNNSPLVVVKDTFVWCSFFRLHLAFFYQQAKLFSVALNCF